MARRMHCANCDGVLPDGCTCVTTEQSLRDGAVLLLHAQGLTVRAIARQTGLSRMGVQRVITAHRVAADADTEDTEDLDGEYAAAMSSPGTRNVLDLYRARFEEDPDRRSAADRAWYAYVDHRKALSDRIALERFGVLKADLDYPRAAEVHRAACELAKAELVSGQAGA